MSETSESIGPVDETRNGELHLTAPTEDSAQPQREVISSQSQREVISPQSQREAVSPQEFHFYTQPLAPNRRLSGKDNYYAWMVNMESNFEGLDLTHCIEGNETDPRLIKQARALIIRNVSDDVLIEIGHMSDPCEMWRYLEKAYDVSKDPSEIAKVTERIDQLSIQEHDSVDDYYWEAIGLFNILKRSRFPPDAKDVERVFVLGFSRKANETDGFWDSFLSQYHLDVDLRGPDNRWKLGLLEVKRIALKYRRIRTELKCSECDGEELPSDV